MQLLRFLLAQPHRARIGWRAPLCAVMALALFSLASPAQDTPVAASDVPPILRIGAQAVSYTHLISHVLLTRAPLYSGIAPLSRATCMC